MRKLQRRGRRWMIWLALGGAMLLGLLMFIGVHWWIQPRTHYTPVQIPLSKTTTVRFAFMGDMLAHDSVVAQAKTATGYDFTPYFTHIAPLYADADVVFCNPETSVAGQAFGISGYPAFNAPSEFARDLAQGARCNLINLATNHMADKGQAAIDETLRVWRAQPKVLTLTGANSTAAEQERVAYFTVNGVKVAFVACMDFSNIPLPQPYSVNSYHDKALMKRLLTTARDQADYVIISAHWGTEDSTVVNTDQLSAAQYFADEGADLVVGTGPHVLQKTDTLTARDGRKVPVMYSLGNLLSSQLKINQLTGVVAHLTLEKQAGGTIATQLSFTPTFMSYDWSAADREAGRLETRRGLLLQPLEQADAQIKSMFPEASYHERLRFVQDTLGTAATVRSVSQ